MNEPGKTIVDQDGMQVVTYTLAECRDKYLTCSESELKDMLQGTAGPNVWIGVEVNDVSVIITHCW